MQSNSVTAGSPASDALPDAGDIDKIALLLDVDGTILDLAVAPESVVVPGSLRSSLGHLHVRSAGALALVSGRLIRNLDGLFAPLRLPAIGGHGAEMRLCGDCAIELRCAEPIAEGLRALVVAAAACDPQIIVEDKGASLAVHYRLAPQMEQMLKTEIAAIVARFSAGGLELLNGKAVIEIKPASVNKGEAVREMMKRPPFAGRKPVFVGDDTTDVAVFDVLPALGGIGYSVGRHIPGASASFGSAQEVRRWLTDLCGRKGNVLQ
jgi:trehalose 6-phosphate phosphatase